MRLVELAQRTIGAILTCEDIAIDATVGNGLDTLFLAQTVGPGGTVYGFDIQEEAIRSAHSHLNKARLQDRCRLFLESHAEFDRHIAKEHQQRIQAIMFNLGYLPGGNKSITTTPFSTSFALQKACSILSPGGRITMLCYTSHPGGQLETDTVKKMVKTLPNTFRIHLERPKNTLKSPPELIVIERCGNLG